MEREMTVINAWTAVESSTLRIITDTTSAFPSYSSRSARRAKVRRRERVYCQGRAGLSIVKATIMICGRRLGEQRGPALQPSDLNVFITAPVARAD